ncbi:MAG: LacI family DNA-binding transcriptional regulator [Chloroflexota bacterium]|nr:LacI family DNA-binding transcriptional regulator [Chloroflexota bacterium]
MRVSIKDIAQAAGVSHSTVSRALSDSPLVKTETKSRIQQLAQEMGYIPNAIARSLVTQHTHTVGVVVTTITDPFVAEVVQGVEDTAQENDYAVILASSTSDPERELAAVEMLRAKRVDTVIVTSSRIGALYLEHLERFGVPVVLVNNHNGQSGRYTFSVSVDNQHGGHLATSHLIKRGHRRVGYVSGPEDHSDDAERLTGYRQALAEASIAFDPSLVLPGNGRLDGGERALRPLASLAEPPTAIFCYNDMTAIGLMSAARCTGVSVPRDLAVVGFDDIPLAAHVCPPLTTLAQPQRDMGRQAMNMALALTTMATSDLTTPFSDIVIRGELIVRESSGI